MQSGKDRIRLTDVCFQFSFRRIPRTVVICYAPVDQSPKPGTESCIPFETLQGANHANKDFLSDILDIGLWYCETNPIVDHRKIALVQYVECIQTAVFGVLDKTRIADRIGIFPAIQVVSIT